MFVCLQQSRQVTVGRIPDLGRALAMEDRIDGEVKENTMESSTTRTETLYVPMPYQGVVPSADFNVAGRTVH